jgi:DNA-binding LacI/PurR family transcriptional regulator
MTARYRIGVLTEETPTACTRMLGEQLTEQALGRPCDIGFLPVGWSNPTHPVKRDEVDEVLARAGQFDVLVLLTGVFSNHLREVSLLAQLWAPRPLVSVAFRLPAVPSVILDNRAGLKVATDHLIVEHGKREILFIKGRADSQEANERFLGYRSALRQHGILFRDELTLQGDFTRAGGVRVMNALRPDLKFDAVVSANDEMALSALGELERRGLRVPEDVALVGVDDITEARTARVPLTTLSQPFEKVASVTLDLLDDQVRARSVPGLVTVPGKLITRRSCGCV